MSSTNDFVLVSRRRRRSNEKRNLNRKTKIAQVHEDCEVDYEQLLRNSIGKFLRARESFQRPRHSYFYEARLATDSTRFLELQRGTAIFNGRHRVCYSDRTVTNSIERAIKYSDNEQ